MGWGYTPLRALIKMIMLNILLRFISIKINNNSQGGCRGRCESYSSLGSGVGCSA